MIGCSVTSMSCSGVRVSLDQVALGRARARAAAAGRRGAVIGSYQWRSSSWSCRLGLWVPVRVKKTSSRLGRCSENSVDRDPGRAQPRHHVGQHLVAGHRDGHVPRPSASGAGPPMPRSRSSRSSSRAGSAGRTVSRCPPTTRLSPSRGVVRDHPAVVDHGDLVGQRVGLLQVLRGEQHGRAVVDQAADDVPHVLALGRVEAGGRLVQEDHLRPAHQGRGQVEAAAHAAGVGLGHLARGLGQVEPGEQLRGPLPGGALGQVEQLADQDQVLRCRSGPRRPRRTGRSARCSGAPCRAACARRTRRPGRCPRRRAAAWPGCGRRWSCRRRSARARRARCRAAPPGPPRPAPSSRRRTW